MSDGAWVGRAVKIARSSRRFLNGQQGFAKSWDDDTGRYKVKLPDNTTLALKAGYLDLVNDDDDLEFLREVGFDDDELNHKALRMHWGNRNQALKWLKSQSSDPHPDSSAHAGPSESTFPSRRPPTQQQLLESAAVTRKKARGTQSSLLRPGAKPPTVVAEADLEFLREAGFDDDELNHKALRMHWGNRNQALKWLKNQCLDAPPMEPSGPERPVPRESEGQREPAPCASGSAGPSDRLRSTRQQPRESTDPDQPPVVAEPPSLGVQSAIWVQSRWARVKTLHLACIAGLLMILLRPECTAGVVFCAIVYLGKREGWNFWQILAVAHVADRGVPHYRRGW
eukprot:TRINITY_DN613_c0_g1_i4.p1 TRINITY_DN613_c0_g1~~TRINITY_DN613_c0_g1_i4.p1  ORF type:complete len:340 (+),score=54.20 TRINITY_DN613_c0_g1_i4:166-1185(+)